MSEQPPRVLHVGKYLPPVPGGIETYLGDLLRVSMRHGMPVGAIVHEKKGYPKPNPNDFGGAKIYSVPTYGQLLYAPVAPRFLWRLRQAIRDFKPDILHLHMPNTSAFATLLLPEARMIPWVVHWHADVEVGRMGVWMRIAYKLYKPFETALLRHAKSIIATSEEYLAASQPLRVWQEKCRVVKLAVDFERLTIPTEDEVRTAAALWHQPSQTRFLAVGRLAKYKGFDFLIGALREIPTGTLVIVGDGPGRCLLEGLKEKLDLQDRVRLIGEVPSAELAAIFAAADVLCMVSFDRSEAFGLVILEAARFGTAIVAAEIRGTPSAGIATRFGGARFPAGDRKALSTVMAGLASGKVQRVPIASGLDLDLQPINRIYTNCRR